MFNLTKDENIKSLIKLVSNDKNKQAIMYDILNMVYLLGKSERPLVVDKNKISLETIKKIDAILPNHYIQNDEAQTVLKDFDDLLLDFKKAESVMAKQIILDKLENIMKIVYLDGLITSLNIEGASAKDVVLEQIKMYNV